MPNHPPSTADFAHYLKDIEFPRSRAELVEHARHHGAEEDTLAVFDAMPDLLYHTMAEVFAGMREEVFARAEGQPRQPVPPPSPAPERPQRDVDPEPDED